MKNQSFIGVFDSGVGGLSVLEELARLLPCERFVYLGDSANAPYGTKSKDEVLERSREICRSFAEEGAKAIIIACNTATSAAAEALRHEYRMPIIGMEPAVKPAFARSGGAIAVLATDMTLREEKFRKLVASMSVPERVRPVPAPELVELVERDFGDDRAVREATERFVREHLSGVEGLSAVVLGCTHFVFLRGFLRDALPKHVALFDGNRGTAERLKNRLEVHGLLESEGTGSVEIRSTAGEDAAQRAALMYRRLADVRLRADRREAELERLRAELETLVAEGHIESELIDPVRLYYIERRNLAEIRERLGISNRKLRERLSRAEAKIFNLLKKKTIDGGTDEDS